MKKKKDICSIVVIGVWNRAIFTPDWVKKYILAKYDGFEIRMPAYPTMDASLQFVTPDFSINIIGQRLEFRVTENSQKAVECLRNILRVLPHTPISSIGINAAYTEKVSNIPNILRDKLTFQEKLNQFFVASSSLITSLKTSEQSFLNIRIISEGEIVTFDFNYDFQINENQKIFSIIDDDDTIIEKKEQETLAILNQLYDLKID